jgi:hypothetical protein
MKYVLNYFWTFLTYVMGIPCIRIVADKAREGFLYKWVEVLLSNINSADIWNNGPSSFMKLSPSAEFFT